MSENSKVLAILVGDGHVTKKGRITLTHGINQKEWMITKIKILEKLGFKMKYYETIQKSFGKVRKFVKAFSTITNRCKMLRKMFYPNDVKVITQEIACLFGFEEWAIIYQDDGRQNKINHYNSIKDGQRVRIECVPFVNRYEIATDSFDLHSIEMMQTNLDKLSINSNIMFHNSKPKLCISRANDKKLFYEGIEKFVIPTMKYKISAKPCLSY